LFTDHTRYHACCIDLRKGATNIVQEDLVLCACDMNGRTATPTSTQSNGLENRDSGSRNGNLSDLWNKKRIIIHVDLNSFYPSCEELRQPSLLGKPHAVIMTHEEQGHITKGVVASCSYEAKKLGVKSATSLSSALRVCPNLILNRVDIPYYVSISQRIMNILYRYSDILEQTSIDEAYLDCTDKIYAQVLQKDHASEANNLSLSSRSFKYDINTSSNVSLQYRSKTR
jgi:hypothetical protein